MYGYDRIGKRDRGSFVNSDEQGQSLALLRAAGFELREVGNCKRCVAAGARKTNF